MLPVMVDGNRISVSSSSSLPLQLLTSLGSIYNSDHWSLRLSNVFLAFLLPTVKRAVLRSLSSCDLMTCPAQLKWLTLMWRTEFTNPAALYSFSFSIIPLFVLYTALKLCSGSFENDRIHFFRQKFSWYIISRRVIWIGYKDHVI